MEKKHLATNGADVKKNGYYYVPFTKLKVLDNFNDREDYGTAEEMDELAESIYHTGVKVPLKGYKDGESYIVIVGHRRHRAGKMIKDKYGKTVIYPMIMYPPGTKKADLLIDTLLTNSGKDLTPLEKASTVHKLFGEKVPIKDITGALGGVSEVYVNNLRRLWEAPEKAKKLIRSGAVSATLVMAQLRKKGNIEDWLAEVEKEAAGAKKRGKGKQAAVTAKRTKKETRAASSIGELKRFRKQNAGVFETKAKQEFFEFICRVFDNQVSYSQILAFFTGK